MREIFAPDFKGRAVTCPYCGSTETELFSLFGQQLLTLQYYCTTCHTPFEHVKDDAKDDERKTTRVVDPSSSRE